MTTLNLYGGPFKREIVKRAYGYCGQSSAEFEIDPEEMMLGVRRLNDLMSLLCIDAYNAPINGDGSPDDESGIPSADVLGVSAMLAQEIAPNIGKALTLSPAQLNAISTLRAKYTVIFGMEMGRQTPRGTGSRYRGGSYFRTDVSDAETRQ